MTSTTPSEKRPQTKDNITVLLVDDSSVIRGALANLLADHQSIEVVGSVANGEVGVSSAQRHQPDIVILDIEMPVMDGLTALPKILEVSPKSKVVMFSTLTEKGADVSIKALSLGAAECFVKPSSAQNVGKGSDFEKGLINIIRGLGGKTRPATGPTIQPTATAPAQIQLLNRPGQYVGKPAIIAIGSSTGGPQALFKVIEDFKGFDIPIVITQHMPATFTKILAEHIEKHTGVPTHEGAEDMPVQNGHIYVAPGGFHMHLVKGDSGLKIHLDNGPPENFCKPAVDPMFRSAIDIFGNKVLGVILTGMGNDGLGGGKILTEKGGRLIAQDEATSVVWGMPGAVAKAGICSEILPLDQIGGWVREQVLGRR